MIKAKKLEKGDMIGIIAPVSGLDNQLHAAASSVAGNSPPLTAVGWIMYRWMNR